MKLITGVPSIFSVLILGGLVFGLQACSGGGSAGSATPVATNADPIGYYAGTLSVTSPPQPNLSAKAIVDSDKFLLTHIDLTTPDSLLYVGTFTGITATTFTADVRIYRNGAFLRTANVTNGSITEKGSMSGTLSGTGDYTATAFSLSYDTVINARTSLASGVNDTWLVPTTSGTGLAFKNATGTIIANVYENIAMIHNNLKGCGVSGVNLVNVSSETSGRIYRFKANYTNVDNCTNFTTNFSVIGYITTFDSGANDNRYLWITYNDNNFFAAELVKK